jgi:hypothetical protein
MAEQPNNARRVVPAEWIAPEGAIDASELLRPLDYETLDELIRSGRTIGLAELLGGVALLNGNLSRTQLRELAGPTARYCELSEHHLRLWLEGVSAHRDRPEADFYGMSWQNEATFRFRDSDRRDWTLFPPDGEEIADEGDWHLCIGNSPSQRIRTSIKASSDPHGRLLLPFGRDKVAELVRTWAERIGTRTAARRLLTIREQKPAFMDQHPSRIPGEWALGIKTLG